MLTLCGEITEKHGRPEYAIILKEEITVPRNESGAKTPFVALIYAYALVCLYNIFFNKNFFPILVLIVFIIIYFKRFSGTIISQTALEAYFYSEYMIVCHPCRYYSKKCQIEEIYSINYKDINHIKYDKSSGKISIHANRIHASYQAYSGYKPDTNDKQTLVINKTICPENVDPVAVLEQYTQIPVEKTS